jgi:ATP-dependent DNA helicase DinG
MTRTYVALDLETTGLDPARDAILEVGAVRFQLSPSGKVESTVNTFSSLVNPERPVPIQIQQLTGISQAEADAAPRLGEVLSQLRRFLGYEPIVGHSVEFDLEFLRRRRLNLSNPVIDTFELAGILMPHAARYSLSKLIEELRLQASPSHRALDDALAARDLLAALLARLSQMPLGLVREVARLSQGTDWSLGHLFGTVSRWQQHLYGSQPSLGQRMAAQLEDDDQLGPMFALEQEERPALKPAQERHILDADVLASMLEENGLFARRFPGFEYRPQQVEMLRAVAEALNDSQHMLVEAGTGVGKSLAYLLPAVTFATRNGQRVVISTNTINLQDQLIDKDIPSLQAILPLEFRAVVLKGRNNYLCQRRLQALRRASNLTVDEVQLLAKILFWLPSTQTGDRGELFLPTATDQAIWAHVSAESETCTLDRCRFRERGRCFFYRTRRAAERAHVVVVNHALLLSDVAAGSRVLPEYKHLIVDEAHHLENNVTRQLSISADARKVERLLLDLARPRSRSGQRTGLVGFLPDVLSALSPALKAGYAQTRGNGPAPATMREMLREQIAKLAQQVGETIHRSNRFFDVLLRFVGEHVSESARYDQRLRLTSAMRVQPMWSQVEIEWDNLALQMDRLLAGLERFCQSLQELDDYGFDLLILPDLVQDCLGHVARVRQMREHLAGCVVEPDPKQIYWARVTAEGEQVSLHAAPLEVGDLMQRHLFHTKESVLLTSATLRTNNQFDFMRERLGAWDADEVAVGSPFDFVRSTLLYLPTDIPEPNQPHYQRAVESALLSLCRATKGRALVLFTSYAQLRATSRALVRPLLRDGVSVFEQGSGASRAQLLENFRTTEQAVLLGTRSFWEGIDVVGPALSVVVIVRLPFSVPSDPIFAARAERFDDPFGEYSLPETILRFRQGFGRLIRTQTDRGVVVVLDRRVQTKSYGPFFLASLPECTVHHGPMHELPRAAAGWLEQA